MAVDRRQVVEKQPYESFPIELNFGRSLPLGATEIVSAEASAEKWLRKNPEVKTNATNEIFVNPVPLILEPNKTKILVFLRDGEHNYDYKMTFRVEFDNGSKLEDEIYLRIREN